MQDFNERFDDLELMLAKQLQARDIVDARVLEAMRAVPRHWFVPRNLQSLAYVDSPLPIGHRQTISQPYIVALMSQLLALRGHERVLEIGTGSGYQTAILGQLASRVYSIEIVAELADAARRNLEKLSISNVEILTGDGSHGLPEHAPYDGILVAAAAPAVPAPLKEQLANGGRLVLPVGGRRGQVLECWQRQDDQLRSQPVTGVAFVPLLGEFGWEDED